jgi:hypothetical protein
MEPSESLQGKIALEFSQKIVAGEFADAHDMLASEISEKISAQQLQAEYEEMVAYGDGIPQFIEVMNILDEWSAKAERDIGWAYVAIAGEGYSEAIAVVVAQEQGQAVIREIEWGRP